MKSRSIRKNAQVGLGLPIGEAPIALALKFGNFGTVDFFEKALRFQNGRTWRRQFRLQSVGPRKLGAQGGKLLGFRSPAMIASMIFLPISESRFRTMILSD